MTTRPKFTPAFTPGPWFAETQVDGRGKYTFGIYKEVEDAVFQDIAYGRLWDRPDERMKADAHLIAAAPELYEALEELAACIDIKSNTHVKATWPGPALAKARAAIAKARGG